MKRYGNLYTQIVEFENILASAKKAQKGKRFRYNVLEFNSEMLNVVTKLYIFKYSSIIKGKNVNIS